MTASISSVDNDPTAIGWPGFLSETRDDQGRRIYNIPYQTVNEKGQIFTGRSEKEAMDKEAAVVRGAPYVSPIRASCVVHVSKGSIDKNMFLAMDKWH